MSSFDLYLSSMSINPGVPAPWERNLNQEIQRYQRVKLATPLLKSARFTIFQCCMQWLLRTTLLI